MLIAPASKVSVPFTVVILTRSSSALRDLDPAVMVTVIESDWFTTPDATQVKSELSSSDRVTEPCLTVAADPPICNRNPAVDELLLDVPERTAEALKYPVASTPPESPIWIRTLVVPLVDTPTNMTVIRFVPAGIE